MIGENIVSQLPFLRRLAQTRKREKLDSIFSQISDDQLECLVEICFNICKGGFALNKTQLSRLKPFKLFIRQLAHKRRPKQAKNQIIQKGSGFPFASLLLPIILACVQQQQQKNVA